MIFLFLSFFLSLTSAFSVYAPAPVICPNRPLVRPADGLSLEEEAYRVARKAKADQALRTWLEKTNAGFETNSLPTVCVIPVPSKVVLNSH